jgi:hypothetical protein
MRCDTFLLPDSCYKYISHLNDISAALLPAPDAFNKQWYTCQATAGALAW